MKDVLEITQEDIEAAVAARDQETYSAFCCPIYQAIRRRLGLTDFGVSGSSLNFFGPPTRSIPIPGGIIATVISPGRAAWSELEPQKLSWPGLDKFLNSIESTA